MAAEQRFRVCKSSTPVPPQRWSPRSPKLASAAQKEVHSISQLPSPSPSRFVVDVPRASRKRKYSDKITSNEEGRHPKRRQVVQEVTKSSPPVSCAIAYWVYNNFEWPKFDDQQYLKMSLPDSHKRKSSSTHHSDRQQRLEQNGIYLKTSAQLQQTSKDLCDRFLDGDLSPDQFPCYPAEKVPDVLDRVQRLNEARLQRDVMPWVVPSPENLVFSGKLAHKFVGEEVQAEWIRCEPMGGSKPKPDLTIGLQRSAFNADEWAKLDNCATSSTPFYFTPNLWFPFLICEAKTDRAGLEAADMQNIHSGSIAVRSVLRICITAYGRHDQRVKDLLGRILVFSVSHNNQQVNVFGHYAVAKDDGNDEGENFEYFRYGIAMFSLGMFGDKERYKAYNFVRNVYDKFAPEHRDRLRDAIGALAKPGPHTGLSFSASELVVNEGLSQSASVQQEGIFKTPSEPASVATRRLMEQMEKQMEKQMEQMEKQMEKQMEQMEKQMEQREKQEKERAELQEKERAELRGQLDTLLQQLAEQRRESKEREDKLLQQLEQQRKESKDEKEQLTAMFSSLTEAKGRSSG